MDAIESRLREAAAALQAAINDAVAAGYIIALPRAGKPVTDIIVSHGGKVADLAEPLDLTDEERASLPAIGGDETDHVMDFGNLKGAPPKSADPSDII